MGNESPARAQPDTRLCGLAQWTPEIEDRCLIFGHEFTVKARSGDISASIGRTRPFASVIPKLWSQVSNSGAGCKPRTLRTYSASWNARL